MTQTIPFYDLGEMPDSSSEIHKDEMNPVLHVESDYVLIIVSKVIDGKRVAGKIIIGDPEQAQDPGNAFDDFWNDLGLRSEYLWSHAMCLQVNMQSIEGFDKFSERTGLEFDGILDELIPNVEDPFEFIEAGDRWVLVEFGQWISGASFKVTAGNCPDLEESAFREEVAERLIYGFGQLDSHVQRLRKN